MERLIYDAERTFPSCIILALFFIFRFVDKTMSNSVLQICNLEIDLIFKCVCLGMCLCVQDPWRPRELNHWILGFELQAGMSYPTWVLRTKLRSSLKAVCALNSFRSLEFFFFFFIYFNIREGSNSLGSLFQKWNNWIMYICNADSILLRLLFFSVNWLSGGCHSENPLKTKTTIYFD